MTPTRFNGVDTVLGAPPDWNEADHGPCEGLPIMRRDGVCISRWSLTWKERFQVLFGKAVYCHVASGQTQPPVALILDS